MKKIFLLLLAFVSINMRAQTVVEFSLTPSGSFVSEDEKDYIVYPFEGKNAHQIFQELSVNASKLYKDPKKVMSVVDDASISIRAYDSEITYIKDFIQSFNLGGYYCLMFEIKDGRVKVSAPIIEESMTKTIDSSKQKDFSKIVKGWFKNGEVKSKNKEQVKYTEQNINSVINAILGTIKSKSSEDW